MHSSLPNTIDYIEMPSRNLAETKRFFAALFGWSFTDYGPDYAAFDDGRMAGGFFASENAAKELSILAARLRRKSSSSRVVRRFHFLAPGGGEFAIWSDK